ncbi:MAG: tetratricopeptide repeat protein, partial [Gammaproteobacteria bacterium]|nr:tetratricopeptide repeat protein [Gammaproteobacteria bacterium]
AMLLLGMGFMLIANTVIAGSSAQQELLSMFDSSSTQLAEPASNTESYLAHADKLLDQQNFKQALNYYNKVIRMDRSIDDAFLGRSIANSGVGRLEDSIADLNVFILRNPRHSMAHVYRGIRYMSQGAHEYAELNLLKAINLNPRNAQAYDDLGVLYAQQGDIKVALEYFNQALRLDPYNEMAYHNLAIAYFLLEDNQKALQAVNKAVRLMPESRDTYILKAQILDSLGLSEEAMKVRNYAQYLSEGHWVESASIN